MGGIQNETDELVQLAKEKIKYVSLEEGRRYGKTTFLGVDAGDYKTYDPRVIRLFRDFFVRCGEWYVGRGDIFPAVVSFVAANGRSWSLQAFPIQPDKNGPGYMSALNALSDDLARQYARISRRILMSDLPRIRKVDFEVIEEHNPFKVPTKFAARRTLSASDIPAALKALSGLDRRAFVFGERGVHFQLVFEHDGGAKTAFRLRPPIYQDLRAASRMANPPLPQPLWSWLYGKPHA